jgi:hypothetical protein
MVYVSPTTGTTKFLGNLVAQSGLGATNTHLTPGVAHPLMTGHRFYAE